MRFAVPLSVLSLGASLGVGSVAVAAVGDVALDDAGDAGIETVVVSGERMGYATPSTSSAMRTDTALIDVPQTVQVVSREQLEDQAQHSLGEALRYVPGTTVGQGEGNRDQVTIRGQNTTADFFLDGVRDDVQYFRSLYNVETVEVLKGPSALAFGRGGGGGVINRVMKTPDSGRFFAAADASVSSFGAWETAVDLNAPVAADSAVRVNAFRERLQNHRDVFAGDRYGLNPQLSIELDERWRLGISYEQVHDDRVTDRGVPSLACLQPCTPGPLPGYRDTFFGVPGVNRMGLDAHIGKVRLDGELAPGLRWNSSVLYGRYDKYYTNVYASGAATSLSGTVPLAAYTDKTDRENLIAQTNLVWDFRLGGVDHKFLFGLEAGQQDTASQRRDGVLSVRSLNLANISYPSVTFPAATRDTVSAVRFRSAFVQDQVSLGQHLELVLGVRFDRFALAGTDLMPNPDRAFGRVDEQSSPRFGLVYKPRENLSFYASRSQSFLPRSGDQFLSLSVVQQNLAPEKFTNHEVGAKWNPAPDLAATLALFQLDRTNATTPDPANPTTTINIGATRTRGVELGLAGRLTDRWQVSGGYAFQQARLRGNGAVVLAQVPEQQFSLWNRYDFNDGFGVGMGLVYQSSQYAAIRTSASVTRLPSFARVDVAVFRQLTERVRLQANIENLLNRTYFADAHNNNNLSTGAPLNGRLTLHMAF